MKTTKRILKYVNENFNEVMHTTLNPEGPGSVRIHLIPPKIENDEIASSVAIINGQDIVPVNISWAILLTEVIKEVNKYNGRAISEWDSKSIVENTVKGVRKVYPLLSRRLIRNDIFTIMKTFTQIAYGNVPNEEIEYISLRDYAPYMMAPHRMDLLVSAMEKDGCFNCNQSCIHCYATGQKLASEKELTTEEWKKIIDKCREAMIPQVTFTGGEPTMRDDLAELVEYAKWFVTRINTNGIKLTEEYCEKLKEASLDSMQITFYSHDESIHNRLVGANRYKDTLSGIENAIKAGINLSINTPLCSLNKDYVRTLEFLKEKGVVYVTCSGLIATGKALLDNSEKLKLSEDELEKILNEAVDFCAKNGMEISFTSPGQLKKNVFMRLNLNIPTCGACLSNMAITPSGNVVPCQSFLSEAPLGNMLSDSWENIWNNPLSVKYRNYSAMQDGLCPLRTKADAEKNDNTGEEK